MNSQITSLVEYINSTHGTDFVLNGKMERGVNGAYLLGSSRGVHILKPVGRTNLVEQVKRSARIADYMNAPQSPTPRYELVGFGDAFGTWYVQEFLTGIPAPFASQKLVEQLVSMNDRQAGAAVDHQNDWSKAVDAALRHDGNGWQAKIAAAGSDGQRLVRRCSRLCEPFGSFNGGSSDIVHGDFQHYNALVDEHDSLTGYVDWPQAGCGDRSIDLARLLIDAWLAEKEFGKAAAQETFDLLKSRIVATSGSAGLSVYMAYWILQVGAFCVGWGDGVGYFKVADRVLSDLGV